MAGERLRSRFTAPRTEVRGVAQEIVTTKPHQLLFLLLFALVPLRASAQDSTFTHADTLRGSLTAERVWWDVTFYDLHVTINPADSTFRGWNSITYRVVGQAREMQID